MRVSGLAVLLGVASGPVLLLVLNLLLGEVGYFGCCVFMFMCNHLAHRSCCHNGRLQERPQPQPLDQPATSLPTRRRARSYP